MENFINTWVNRVIFWVLFETDRFHIIMFTSNVKIESSYKDAMSVMVFNTQNQLEMGLTCSRSMYIDVKTMQSMSVCLIYNWFFVLFLSQLSKMTFFKLQNGASENLAIISLFPFNFSFIFSLTREAELCQPLPT